MKAFRARPDASTTIPAPAADHKQNSVTAPKPRNHGRTRIGGPQTGPRRAPSNPDALVPVRRLPGDPRPARGLCTTAGGRPETAVGDPDQIGLGLETPDGG